MNKINMLFSIIIPSYKKRYLDEAIKSVVSQTCDNWELIVVNDCSPEDLHAVVMPYLGDSRVRYYVNENNFGSERLCENWNNCLKYCNGDYVICMGDDDRLTPVCLDEYSRLIDKYPLAEVFHGQTEVIDENGNVCELMEPRFEHETALQLIYYRWSGLGRQQFIGDFCYKKYHLIHRGGFYNLPLAWGSDDISAVIAATSSGGIANTEKICFQYRKNRFSISSDTNNRRKADALILQWEWYEKYFQDYITGNRQEEITLALLKEMMPVHFTTHLQETMRKDMHRGKFNVLYWLKNRNRYRITTGGILYQFVKSFK